MCVSLRKGDLGGVCEGGKVNKGGVFFSRLRYVAVFFLGSPDKS